MIGSYHITSGVPAQIGGLGSIRINNNGIAALDYYRVDIMTYGAPIGSLMPLLALVDLTDQAGTALTSKALTSEPPVLSAFAHRTMTFQFSGFNPGSGEFLQANAVGQLTSLAAVPIPAGAVLFGWGLIGLTGYRRRNSRSQSGF